MAAEDDAQAFLEAFEVAAEACQWPREEWVVRLLPLLSGEAQQAAHSLLQAAKNDYKNIRKAVLDSDWGIAPRSSSGGFATWSPAAEDHSFAYAQRLAGLSPEGGYSRRCGPWRPLWNK